MATPQESQRNPEPNWLRSGLKYALAVIFAAVIYGALVYRLAGDGRGTFGDMFGGLNAVFAGFAFVALIIALLMQQEELRLQRTELPLTREELQRSADAQQLTQEALSEQVEQMRYSAKLTSLSTIYQALDPLARDEVPPRAGILIAERNEALKELRKMIGAVGCKPC